jgi:hypothetical protein
VVQALEALELVLTQRLVAERLKITLMKLLKFFVDQTWCSLLLVKVAEQELEPLQ